jgi:hypothetical protein
MRVWRGAERRAEADSLRQRRHTPGPQP